MRRLENIYHTDNATDEEVVKQFVVRKLEFNNIIKTIKDQGKKGLQNFLIIGKRGMGKSTLLRRVEIEINTIQKDVFEPKLVAIRLSSEGYRISRLYKLWETIIDKLAEKEPSLLNQQKELEKTNNYEENLIHLITDYLHQQDRSLLLLIDNLDSILQAINKKEEHQLREILIQFPLQIIGNTMFYDEKYYAYDQPFFDFFKIVSLKNLTPEETTEFINLLIEEENSLGNRIKETKKQYTIDTLRILSGGVPRTIVMLVSVLFDDNLDTTVSHLKKLLELVTPLYQDRMKSLSNQQKEIMWAMATIWNKTGVNEIAKLTRMESKNVSAQMKVLEQNGYIIKDDIPGRTNYYLIDERFFNIWLLMSEGTKKDGQRVLWLTKTLDMILDQDEIGNYAKNCFGKMKDIENKAMFTKALYQSEKLSTSNKLELLNTFTSEEHSNEEDRTWANEKIEELSVVNEPDISKEKDPFDLAFYHLTESKDFAKAEQYLLLAIENKHTGSMYNLALLYQTEYKDFTKAELYYLMAIENKNAYAMFNLAILYENEFKNFAKAEQYYLMAIENKHTGAMNNLALLYKNEFKNFAKAERYYLMAIENKKANAMNNLAFLYQTEYKDFAKAEHYYLIAIENKEPHAMHNLANLYFEENRNQVKVLDLVNQSLEYDWKINTVLTKVEVLLWNGETKEALITLKNLLDTQETVLIDFQEQFMDVLTTFMIFKQTNALYELFSNEVYELKDKFKPFYFALLSLMQKEKPKEFMTMPPELLEPVEKILNQITVKQKKYNV
jgi:TPR repeat protein